MKKKRASCARAKAYPVCRNEHTNYEPNNLIRLCTVVTRHGCYNSVALGKSVGIISDWTGQVAIRKLAPVSLGNDVPRTLPCAFADLCIRVLAPTV